MEQQENNNEIKHSPIIENAELLHTTPYVNLKKIDGFYFAERKGVDSVAFVLFATNTNDEKRIGLIDEFKIPVNKSLVTAFGGSIDDEKYHNDLRTLVQEEVLEESGFTVKLEDIDYYGKMYVSTQMNQFCHLFGVTVDKNLQGLRTTTNPRELESVVTWITVPEVLQLEDWKALTIVTKRMASRKITLNIRPINNQSPTTAEQENGTGQ